MTTELATINALALVPRGFEEAEKLSEKLSKCTLLPDHFRGKPADIFWALAKGIELGITPTQAVEGIFVINGKPGMYVELMHAVILSSGMAEYFRPVEVTAASATWETKRRGDDKVHRKTVTIEMARAAGWDRNAKYKSEPDVMLSARARGRLAKEIYPDILRGMSPIEELRDEPPEQVFTAPPPTTGKVIDIIESKPPAAAKKAEPAKEEAPAAQGDSDLELAAKVLHKAIVETTSQESLTSLVEELSALTKQLGKDHQLSAELRTAYKQQKALLAKAGGGQAA